MAVLAMVIKEPGVGSPHCLTCKQEVVGCVCRQQKGDRERPSNSTSGDEMGGSLLEEPGRDRILGACRGVCLGKTHSAVEGGEDG